MILIICDLALHTGWSLHYHEILMMMTLALTLIHLDQCLLITGESVVAIAYDLVVFLDLKLHLLQFLSLGELLGEQWLVVAVLCVRCSSSFAAFNRHDIGFSATILI